MSNSVARESFQIGVKEERKLQHQEETSEYTRRVKPQPQKIIKQKVKIKNADEPVPTSPFFQSPCL